MPKPKLTYEIVRKIGAEGRSRTDTPVKADDFESSEPAFLMFD